MLSYFGTDQSQVQRYLSGSSVTQSRMGLLMNGFLKIPMQFFILFIGAMVFVFFQFIQPPIFFNTNEVDNVKSSEYSEEFSRLVHRYSELHNEKQSDINNMLDAIRSDDSAGEEKYKSGALDKIENARLIREEALSVMEKANPELDRNDTNYIFLNFVVNFLPVGLIGLVLAAILSASMSSTSAELNALPSTSWAPLFLEKQGFKITKLLFE